MFVYTCLYSVVFYPWINHAIYNIGHEICNNRTKCENVEHSLHHREILVTDTLVEPGSQTSQVEHMFSNDRATKIDANERELAVTMGNDAFLKACLNKTVRSLRPFARAVII